MSFRLTWMLTVLKNAGLKVAEVDGWQDRGAGNQDVGPTMGVICHHTAGQRNGNMPSLHTLIHGRSDLSGPLAQLGLARDGTYYLVAAGRCNHAGKGEWEGITSGNTNFIGIEAENTGERDDTPWPDIQIAAYHHGVAAILKHIGRGPAFCCGHREYALPKGRKDDPDFDMVQFRAAVKAILDGTTPPLVPIPASSPSGRKTLRRGMVDPSVKILQAKIGVSPDGDFGPATEAAVREFQRNHGIAPDGIVGPKTWQVLDTVRIS